MLEGALTSTWPLWSKCVCAMGGTVNKHHGAVCRYVCVGVFLIMYRALKLQWMFKNMLQYKHTNMSVLYCCWYREATFWILFISYIMNVSLHCNWIFQPCCPHCLSNLNNVIYLPVKSNKELFWEIVTYFVNDEGNCKFWTSVSFSCVWSTCLCPWHFLSLSNSTWQQFGSA